MIPTFLEEDSFGGRIPQFLFACGPLLTGLNFWSAPPRGPSEGHFVGLGALGSEGALVTCVLHGEVFP